MSSTTRPLRRFWSPVRSEGTKGPVDTVGPRRLRLRRRRPRDLARCARLLRLVAYESGFPSPVPASPRAWLADVEEAWVVERHDEVLGHVALSRVGADTVTAYRWRETTGLPPERLVAVSRLFVRPRARRQGLGTALLAAAVAEAGRRGLVPVLQVCDAHRDAVDLVTAQGWRLLAMDLAGPRGDRRRTLCYVAPPTV